MKHIKIKAKKLQNHKEFDTAVQCYQSGQLQQASLICERILRRNADNADALHLLGLLACQMKRFNDGIAYFNKAICASPFNHIFHNNRGNACLAAGLPGEAIESYKNVLSLKSDYAEAYYNLGLALTQKGDSDGAIENYRRAVSLKPAYAEAYLNLGILLSAAGVKDEAMEYLNKHLAFGPPKAIAYFYLGNIYYDIDMPDKAIENYARALADRPDFSEAFMNLGLAFRAKGLVGKAVENYKKSVALKPDYAEAYNNLGCALMDKGLIDEAHENYEKSLALKVDARTHMNLAMLYLLIKDFEKGWAEFEWRLKAINVAPLAKESWDGGPLEGKSILVYAEQGNGDTLQFVRYLPELYERYNAGKVLFILNGKGLDDLLRESGLKAGILDAETPPEMLEYDTNIHLMSLPRIFKTDLENMPFRQKRYLKANEEKVRMYREKFFHPSLFTLHPSPLKIGVFWQGNPSLKADRNRSMPLHHLYKLCRLPNLKVYSLQKGPGIEQLDHLPDDIDITNLGNTFNDFSDTAAAIENLDLVLTVDTAIAHLSGALGKKTWILLPSHAEWRWHLDMDYSPWYEDVRLFRHKEPGKKDWVEMMERVMEQVRAECRRK